MQAATVRGMPMRCVFVETDGVLRNSWERHRSGHVDAGVLHSEDSSQSAMDELERGGYHLVVCRLDILARTGEGDADWDNGMGLVRWVLGDAEYVNVNVIVCSDDIEYLGDADDQRLVVVNGDDIGGLMNAIEWVYDAVQHWETLDEDVRTEWLNAALPVRVDGSPALARDAALRGYEEENVSADGAQRVKERAGHYVNVVLADRDQRVRERQTDSWA